MIETEIKIKISQQDFDRVYEYLGRPALENEKNWGFESDIGMLRLREYNGKRTVTLKYESEGPYNSRQEYEFSVDEIESVSEFFTKLGFNQNLYYEKRRAIVNLGDYLICLDDVKDLGNFVEIEGERQDIENTLHELNLLHYENETRSYFDMIKNLS